MFENLWEEDPKIQAYVARKLAERAAKAQSEGLSEGFAVGFAESFLQGRIQGIVEGELLAIRKAIVKIVAKNYPSLSDFALNQVWKFGSMNALDQLFEQISDAEDEKTVLLLLNDVTA